MKILVNGVFDLFHEGHKHILTIASEWAGNNGEVRVLINSDKSVRSLKGPNRPTDSFDRRLRNVINFLSYKDSQKKHSTSSVSWNTFTEEYELGHLINLFEPDLILKGSDYKDVTEVRGNDKWPVCILPRLKDANGNDISTTNKLGE